MLAQTVKTAKLLVSNQACKQRCRPRQPVHQPAYPHRAMMAQTVNAVKLLVSNQVCKQRRRSRQPVHQLASLHRTMIAQTANAVKLHDHRRRSHLSSVSSFCRVMRQCNCITFATFINQVQENAPPCSASTTSQTPQLQVAFAARTLVLRFVCVSVVALSLILRLR